MDPISQGTVGAAFAQSTANKNNIVRIGVIGFLAGLAPDLDGLIRSSNDPILLSEFKVLNLFNSLIDCCASYLSSG